MEDRTPESGDCVITLDEWRAELEACSVGRLPTGVRKDHGRPNSYVAQGWHKSKKYSLARKSTPEEAHAVYVEFNKDKEKWLREHGRLSTTA